MIYGYSRNCPGELYIREGLYELMLNPEDDRIARPLNHPPVPDPRNSKDSEGKKITITQNTVLEISIVLVRRKMRGSENCPKCGTQTPEEIQSDGSWNEWQVN